MNLLSNACKFTKDGSIEVNVWVTEQKEDQDRDWFQTGRIFVSVKDSGTGIPEKEIPKLF